MSVRRSRPILSLCLVLFATSVSAWADEEVRRSSVGKPAVIEQIVLPGGELEAKPVESRRVPLVVRVAATYPHGTAFRYDLEYYGLDPGRYDLRDYLQRKDGSGVDDLAELPVEIVSLLPAGQILPNDLESRPRPRLGGYRVLLLAAAAAWILGAAAILLVGRRKRDEQAQQAERPISLAERLTPLVTAAVEGRMSPTQRTAIERLLVTYWRRRLKLDELDPRAAVAALREHEEAGALLRQVEAWLHMPEGGGKVDVAALLAPYRDLPAEPAQSSGADGPHATQLSPIPTTSGGGRS